MLEGDDPIEVGSIVLGKYRVDRILGRGGMGVVAAVHDVETSERFALKVLSAAIVHQPSVIERFLREAAVVKDLRSEHIAKVYRVDRLSSGLPCLLMDYLEGASLEDVLETRQKNRTPFGVGEVIVYILQACDALEEAHSRGVVHRDIKPANLFLIRPSSASPDVRVLDFGIAKIAAQESSDEKPARGSRLTQTGMLLGSMPYMAPEQIRSPKDTDARTDIWSLGVVLYELLTGITPFCSSLPFGELIRIQNEDPLPPSVLRPEVPDELSRIILRCLSKRPDDRFQSARDLAAALSSVLRALRSSSPPPSVESPATAMAVAAIAGKKTPFATYSASDHPAPPVSDEVPTHKAPLRPRDSRPSFPGEIAIPAARASAPGGTVVSAGVDFTPLPLRSSAPPHFVDPRSTQPPVRAPGRRGARDALLVVVGVIAGLGAGVVGAGLRPSVEQCPEAPALVAGPGPSAPPVDSSAAVPLAGVVAPSASGIAASGATGSEAPSAPALQSAMADTGAPAKSAPAALSAPPSVSQKKPILPSQGVVPIRCMDSADCPSGKKCGKDNLCY